MQLKIIISSLAIAELVRTVATWQSTYVTLFSLKHVKYQSTKVSLKIFTSCIKRISSYLL